MSPQAIILSGGPCSVIDEDSPKINTLNFRGKVPILGLCYGAQLLAHQDGGSILRSEIREYGRAKLNFIGNHTLMKKIHPDISPELTRLASIVNEAKDVVLRNI